MKTSSCACCLYEVEPDSVPWLRVWEVSKTSLKGILPGRLLGEEPPWTKVGRSSPIHISYDTLFSQADCMARNCFGPKLEYHHQSIYYMTYCFPTQTAWLGTVLDQNWNIIKTYSYICSIWYILSTAWLANTLNQSWTWEYHHWLIYDIYEWNIPCMQTSWFVTILSKVDKWKSSKIMGKKFCTFPRPFFIADFLPHLLITIRKINQTTHSKL